MLALNPRVVEADWAASPIELIKRVDQYRWPAYWRAFLAASLSSSAGGSGRYGKSACTAGQSVDPQSALDTLAWATRNRGAP